MNISPGREAERTRHDGSPVWSMCSGGLGQEDMNRDQPSDETFLFALPMVIRMQREVRAELTLREKTIWEGTHRRVSRTSLSPSRAHLVPHARV